MNNKKIGSDFERAMCKKLSSDGWWVHFVNPDARGAQPFDIIAVRDGIPVAIDCKTCDNHIFRLSRLEDNQRLAFDKWIACGNSLAYLAVLHDEKVYMVYYDQLLRDEKVLLDEMEAFDDWHSI